MSRISDQAAPQTVAPGACPGAAVSEVLPKLSVHELISELSRVEESLRALTGLSDGADEPVPDPDVQDLLRHERAIVHELTARRRRRGLVAAPLVREGAPTRTPPPWR